MTPEWLLNTSIEVLYLRKKILPPPKKNYVYAPAAGRAFYAGAPQFADFEVAADEIAARNWPSCKAYRVAGQGGPRVRTPAPLSCPVGSMRNVKMPILRKLSVTKQIKS